MDVRRAFVVSFLGVLLAASAHSQSKPTLVCFGDSITAGYGLAPGQSYPDALRRDLDKLGYRYQVVNLGTSGATTKDAVERLPTVLRLHPSVVIVEFGGNDGLRGLPLSATRQNLDIVLTTLLHAHIRVLLGGITLPPNYGPDYVHAFDQVFRQAAARTRVAFVPMIYKDLIHVPGTIQPDGIHPTAKGSEILARTLLPALEPLLHKPRAASR
ncbi:MAG TPA: arylesterase [Terracidiphilus sp.]|nr:arylesterase [Terracidiphilus sp.]